AEIGNILKFESDFPGALIVRLEENYRSTPEILAAAAGVIAHNQGRLGKTLWTRAGEGDKVVVRGLWDAEQEARWVGDEIEALQRLHSAARAESLPLVEAARDLIAGDKLPRAGRNALAGFLASLDRWRAEADHVSHTDLVQIVLDESGYTGMWQADKSPDAPG